MEHRNKEWTRIPLQKHIEQGTIVKSFILFISSLFFTFPAQAANLVSVKDAWARVTPPGVEVGVAYLTLEAKQTLQLTKARSNVSQSVEFHNMTMNNGVMQMRQLPNLPLPAGKPVKLEPGGLHLMLIDLKKPLKSGDKVQLELQFSQGKRVVETLKLEVPVKTPQ